MANLVTGKIGHLELHVDDERYVCSWLQYRMAINQIPVVQLAVDSGTSVLYPNDVLRPEDLLIRLGSEKNNLLACTIVEYGNGRVDDTVIFKGYIVSGGAQCSGSGLRITFTCMGAACKLMAASGSQYVEAPLATVLSAMRGDSKEISFERALLENNYMRSQPSNFKILDTYLRSRPIVDIVAVLVSATRTAMSTESMYDMMAALNDGSADISSLRDANVLEAFGGRTALDDSALPDECLTKWSAAFRERLLNSSSGGGAYAAISELASPYFMLELVPRWTCDEQDDFRTDIKPVTAWAPRVTERLEAGQLLSFMSSRDSMAAVSTPDVVLVTAGDPRRDDVAASGGRADGLTGAAMRGAAAKDPDLNEKLRAWSEGDGAPPAELSNGLLRVRTVAMPTWASVHPWQPGGEQSAEKRHALANRLAMCMLQYYYRNKDNLQLAVSPLLRFGLGGTRYEDLLGERIVVDLSGNANRQFNRLSAYGCLSEIRYAYDVSSGSTASASYELTLSRVMFGEPGSTQEGTLASSLPIYKGY